MNFLCSAGFIQGGNENRIEIFMDITEASQPSETGSILGATFTTIITNDQCKSIEFRKNIVKYQRKYCVFCNNK